MSKTLYAITAHIDTATMGSGDTAWRGSVSVPTFYLDSDVQGITGEDHAERIARVIIDPLRTLPDERIHIHACRVELASHLAPSGPPAWINHL